MALARSSENALVALDVSKSNGPEQHNTGGCQAKIDPVGKPSERDAASERRRGSERYGRRCAGVPQDRGHHGNVMTEECDLDQHGESERKQLGLKLSGAHCAMARPFALFDAG
jgi:hypothetical protein